VVDLPEPEPLSFWRELVREFQPELSDAEINHILAEHTSWPSAAKEVIVKQVEEYMKGMGFNRQTNGK
jgi:hypothetical protein